MHMYKIGFFMIKLVAKENCPQMPMKTTDGDDTQRTIYDRKGTGIVTNEPTRLDKCVNVIGVIYQSRFSSADLKFAFVMWMNPGI